MVELLLELVVFASAATGFIASVMGFISYKRETETMVCRRGSRADCFTVYSIPQSWILGFHISELSPPFFLALLVLSVGLLFGMTAPARLLSIMALGGALLVPYLVYLEVRVARAICVYCTIMHVTLVIIAVSMLPHFAEAIGLT